MAMTTRSKSRMGLTGLLINAFICVLVSLIIFPWSVSNANNKSRFIVALLVITLICLFVTIVGHLILVKVEQYKDNELLKRFNFYLLSACVILLLLLCSILGYNYLMWLATACFLTIFLVITYIRRLLFQSSFSQDQAEDIQPSNVYHQTPSNVP